MTCTCYDLWCHILWGATEGIGFVVFVKDTLLGQAEVSNLQVTLVV
jgi:hypothetical protein